MVPAEEAAVVGCGGAGSFEEGVEEILQRFGGRNGLLVEATNADGVAHVQQLVAVVPVDLLHDFLVPVRLQWRFLHLPRNLFLQRLLHCKHSPS